MSRDGLDTMARSEYRMHIVEQAAQGLQRRLHGLAEHMVGPEMLSREALRLALNPWRLALDRWRRLLNP